MTTVVAFRPSNVRPFDFPATLDGGTYRIVVTWNVSAQRFYINVYDSTNNWVLTTPLVSTPPGRQLNSVVYDSFMNVLHVTMISPDQWPVPLSSGGLAINPGTMIDYTLAGFQPNTYNGKFRGMHKNELEFDIPMPTDPGPLVVVGYVDRLINMIGSIFQISTLAYRNGAFEITP